MSSKPLPPHSESGASVIFVCVGASRRWRSVVLFAPRRGRSRKLGGKPQAERTHNHGARVEGREARPPSGGLLGGSGGPGPPPRFVPQLWEVGAAWGAGSRSMASLLSSELCLRTQQGAF